MYPVVLQFFVENIDHDGNYSKTREVNSRKSMLQPILVLHNVYDIVFREVNLVWQSQETKMKCIYHEYSNTIIEDSGMRALTE